ncbi:MAG: MinD/ParA family protein [Phycisphaerales bacterium]|nr:MinD/ParA family protein [Phycisphaerales bacterium]
MSESPVDQATTLRRLVQEASRGASALGESLPASVQTGQVSFGPQRFDAPPRSPAIEIGAPVRLARALAIASGKGGVGKSNVAVNLSVGLAQLGVRTVLLDADLGLANADVLCGLSPRITLDDVVARRSSLAEAVVAAPGGFRLVPGASGVVRMANLPTADRNSLLRELESLERMADVIVIDTGAGIGPNVVGFAAAARSVVVVVTPEPTSITDAYAMVKSLHARCKDLRVELLVNMAGSESEARDVHARIDRVAQAFLGRTIGFAGAVPLDAAVREAVRGRYPVTLLRPRSPAGRAFRRLARRYVDAVLEETAADQARQPSLSPGTRPNAGAGCGPHGGIEGDWRRPRVDAEGGLFARLAGWMRGSGGHAAARHRPEGVDR